MTRARAASALLLIIAATVAVAMIARTWSTGVDALTPDEIRWGFAALSVAAIIAFLLLYAVCWWMIMSALEGRHVALVPAIRLFLLTWPGRYVPASLPHYGGRLAAGPGIGLTRGALAASFVYENLFAIAGAGALSVALLLVGYHDRLGSSLWLIAAMAAVPLAVAALHPAVARTAIRLGARRIKRLAALEQHVLHTRDVVRIGATYIVASALLGFAFWCALRAVGGDAPLFLAMAAYNIAGVAGMLAIAVPSGVGVREGVVVAILGTVVSPPVALSAAVLARLAGVVADLTPFALILLAGLVRRLVSRRPAIRGRRALERPRAA